MDPRLVDYCTRNLIQPLLELIHLSPVLVLHDADQITTGTEPIEEQRKRER
jgi:hypothetical protein